MPHCLCFVDLSLSGKSGVNGEEGAIVADALAHHDVASAPAAAKGESASRPIVLFAQEEGKKSSFALARACALCSVSGIERKKVADSALPTPSSGDCNDDASQDVVTQGGASNACKENTMVAMACISCCVLEDTGEGETQQLATTASQQTFLFGGFELIANVKTVEVYVCRSSDSSDASGKEPESYLTTSKGVPNRDLPALDTAALYVDGTTVDEEVTNAANETGGTDTFYKFILVSPGGPKPMKRVRLKFVGSSTSSENCCVVVRTLKVKGRLPDSMPDKASQQQQTMQAGPSISIPGMQSSNGMNGMAAMMAMMGGQGPPGMQMGMPQTSPLQQQLMQMQMQSAPGIQNVQQLQRQQQQSNREQEMKQAEIMSSIAGLGMFLKSSEERTARRIETMLSEMEARITKRLDDLSTRLDAIERGTRDNNHASTEEEVCEH